MGNQSPEPDLVQANNAVVTNLAQASHPPGIIIALPERTTQLGSHRGELLRMG
jgi:hypothetical protein